MSNNYYLSHAVSTAVLHKSNHTDPNAKISKNKKKKLKKKEKINQLKCLNVNLLNLLTEKTFTSR